jgi:hypothetical protein
VKSVIHCPRPSSDGYFGDTLYEKSNTSDRVGESLDRFSECIDLDEPISLSAEIVTHQGACAKA